MTPVEETPEALRRLEEIGGVLDVALFDDAAGRDPAEEGRAGIAAALARLARGWHFEWPFDPVPLAAVSPRRLTREAFLGDWCDPATGALLVRGAYTTRSGETLTDPPYDRLEAAGLRSGGGPIPNLWAPGGFAYAFSHPPYRLEGEPGEVGRLFRQVCNLLLPPRLDAEILDWGGPHLPHVSRYFEAGAEWWGAFAWTIHVPATRRLAVVLASATD